MDKNFMGGVFSKAATNTSFKAPDICMIFVCLSEYLNIRLYIFKSITSLQIDKRKHSCM